MTKFIINPNKKIKICDVGIKAFNLNKLIQEGYKVPYCNFLSIHAYQHYIKFNNFSKLIDEFEKSISKNINKEKIKSKLETIKTSIKTGNMPEDIESVFKTIKEDFNLQPNEKLAIRSSGTKEDSESYSFAGQFKTVLNVNTNSSDISKAIKKVWASQWDWQSIQYQIKNNIYTKSIGIGIIIQKMIKPDIAGVLFTHSPTAENEETLMLEYVRGLGDKLVSGEEIPEQLIIDRKIPIKIQKKTPILDVEKIEELIEISIKLENNLGYPIDIEWALEKNKIYFLQVRPITNIKKSNEQKIEWTDENVGEVIPDIVTPMTWSLMGKITNNSFYYFLDKIGIKKKENIQLFQVFWGKVYLNGTKFRSILEIFYISKILDKFRKGQKGFFRIIISLIQIFKTLIKSSWLVLMTPGRNKRFLKKHAMEIKRFKNNIDEKLIIELLNTHQQTMNLHVTVTFLGEIFYQGLNAFVEKWKLNEHDISVDVLVQGLQEVESSWSGRELLELSRKFSKNEKLVNILLNEDNSDIVKTMSEQYTNEFNEYRQFIEKFGHSALHEFELYYPRWSEDPSYIFSTIKSYIQNERLDQIIKTSENDLNQSRLQAIQKSKEKLRIIQWIFFDFVLNKTQKFMVQRERLKQAFLRLHLILKQYLIEIGTKLEQEKLIENRNDILFLQYDEISRINQKNMSEITIKEKISNRRIERQSYLEKDHPTKLIQIGNRIIKNEIDEEESGTLIFKGIGCSDGNVTGTARIIHDPENIKTFNSGDILVAPSTNPGWTPLFVMAGGIVTEIGGALSHGAIIAREYGIPLVTAIPGIIKNIPDGSIVEVDGLHGTVKLIEAENR